MLDPDLAARQLLRAVRGSRSQVAFSRRLRYRSNVAADWEQGRRFPTAGEFLRACRVVGVDVDQAFERFHAPAAQALGPGDDAGVAAWLTVLRGTTVIQDIATRTGHSRHALGRWFSGQTRPRLPDFLALIDALTGRLHDWVNELVDVDALPVLAARVARADAARAVFADEPWSVPVLLLVETVPYQSLGRHSDAWLARVLGLSESRVATCVRRLAAAGLLAMDRGLYQPGPALTIDTRARPEVRRMLKHHWLQVGAERLGEERETDILAYNLFAVSERDLGAIRTLQRQFFRQVRAIVAASEPSETVALLNLQLLTWDAYGESKVSEPTDSP